MLCTPLLHGQASAIPSADPNAGNDSPQHARRLLDQMVQALGGEKWLDRDTWMEKGKAATFYKSQPNPYVAEFESYFRAKPFGERVVIVSKMGVFIPTSKRDIAEVYTPDDAFEVTYKGKKELPKKDVDEYLLRRRHALDVVVNQWLKEPDVLITYEGTDVVERHITQKVSIINAKNEGVVLELDEANHLPLSLSFQSRNETYHDFDTDEEQFDNYHPIDGIMTPMTITWLHNGDMVSQRFLTEVDYDVHLSPDLFNPDRPLMEKIKK